MTHLFDVNQVKVIHPRSVRTAQARLNVSVEKVGNLNQIQYRQEFFRGNFMVFNFSKICLIRKFKKNANLNALIWPNARQGN